MKSKHLDKFMELHADPRETVVVWSKSSIRQGINIQNGVLIVTQSRVVFYRKGFVKEVIDAIPLQSIESVKLESTMLTRNIRIRTRAGSGDLVCEIADKDKAKEIIAAMAADAREIATLPTQQESALDKLKKLGELKDAGVLSEEEFVQQKQKLLADL